MNINVSFENSSIFLLGLTIIFVILKCTGAVNWSWIWVFAPLWIPFAVVIAIIVLVAVFVVVRKIIKK